MRGLRSRLVHETEYVTTRALQLAQDHRSARDYGARRILHGPGQSGNRLRPRRRAEQQAPPTQYGEFLDQIQNDTSIGKVNRS